MPTRRLFAVGLWLCVTAAATTIVWAGTSTVAADLTDRPAPVVAHGDVVKDLESGSSAARTAPGISAPKPNGPNSTVASAGAGSAVAAPNAPASGPSGSQTPQPGVAAPTPPAAPPTTQPSRPPTTQAPGRPTATYSTAGGVATVVCNSSFFIGLVSATPANGYAVNVGSAGPYYVEVHFVGRGQDYPIWAYCLGQPIRAYGGSSIPGPRGPS